MPESLMSFLLLANSKIDSNQLLSILSAATSQYSATSVAKPRTNRELTNLAIYDPIANILRQCDNHSSSSNVNTNNPLAGTVRHPFRRLTPQQFAEAKAESRC